MSSGIPYSRFAAQYYRVHQNVRGMIPIHHVCIHAHPRESIAWYLCYRYVGDRSTCEAIAEAMQIEIEKPEMPEDVGETDVLAESALYAQEQDVATALSDPLSVSRARDVKTLVACMDRRRRYGAALEAIELAELGELLSARPRSFCEGFATLDAAIREHRLEDEPLVQYLSRHAYRDEWLYAPAVNLYPDRKWAEID